jgi:two-component system, NtrC family, response regulator PilR
MTSILVVDDEPSMREFLKILLEKEGYQVTTAADGSSALKLAENDPFDLVISDIRMPGLTGLELLARLKQLRSEIAVIMITAFASPDDAVAAMKNGAFDYITKPFNVDEIKRVIRSALKKKQQETPDLERCFPEIIGRSPEMMKIFDLIKKIAPTPANVLIYGESGTGKELVAKAIHNRSQVAATPLSPSPAAPSPKAFWKVNFSAMSRGRLPGRLPTRPACSNRQTTARLFSMKSAS